MVHLLSSKNLTGSFTLCSFLLDQQTISNSLKQQISSCFRTWNKHWVLMHMLQGTTYHWARRESVHLISRLCSPLWKIWGSHWSGCGRPAPFSSSTPRSARSPVRGKQPWGRRGFAAQTLHSSSSGCKGLLSWSKDASNKWFYRILDCQIAFHLFFCCYTNHLVI